METPLESDAISLVAKALTENCADEAAKLYVAREVLI